MTTVTFDTLKFVERLRAAGVPELQAKAMAEAQIEALGEATALTLATKADIYDIKSELRADEVDARRPPRPGRGQALAAHPAGRRRACVMTANTLRPGGKDLATKADIIQYRIPLVTGDLVASPRGFELLLPS